MQCQCLDKDQQQEQQSNVQAVFADHWHARSEAGIWMVRIIVLVERLFILWLLPKYSGKLLPTRPGLLLFGS